MSESVHAPPLTATGLGKLRTLVTAVWVTAAAVQFVVWLIVGLASGFDGPWWLWTVLVGGAATGALHYLDNSNPTNARPPTEGEQRL